MQIHASRVHTNPHIQQDAVDKTWFLLAYIIVFALAYVLKYTGSQKYSGRSEGSVNDHSQSGQNNECGCLL